MLGNIALVGKSRFTQFIRFELKTNLKVMGFEQIDDAKHALDTLIRRKFPAIILHEELAAGDAELPVDINNGRDIACYVIKEVRNSEINKETPIVVTHCRAKPEYEKKYVEAGATGCIDMTKYGPGAFSSKLREYL
ncbi:hypothetical protein KY308_01735 [Candidatus Woesearchaeota archaeon]|nr:hypothetical protein [Candidatus Woesearchaeota archaeon]